MLDTNTKTTEARIVAKGTGASFSMMGITLTEVVRSENFNGALTVLEQVVTPGAGSPPHILHDADKVFFILEGEFEFILGEGKAAGSAGSWVIIPRGTVHNFRNSGLKPGMLLVFTTPGGHERFLRDFSQIAREGRPPLEKMVEVGSRHNVEILPPRQS